MVPLIGDGDRGREALGVVSRCGRGPGARVRGARSAGGLARSRTGRVAEGQVLLVVGLARLSKGAAAGDVVGGGEALDLPRPAAGAVAAASAGTDRDGASAITTVEELGLVSVDLAGTGKEAAHVASASAAGVVRPDVQRGGMGSAVPVAEGVASASHAGTAGTHSVIAVASDRPEVVPVVGKRIVHGGYCVAAARSTTRFCEPPLNVLAPCDQAGLERVRQIAVFR